MFLPRPTAVLNPFLIQRLLRLVSLRLQKPILVALVGLTLDILAGLDPEMPNSNFGALIRRDADCLVGC